MKLIRVGDIPQDAPFQDAGPNILRLETEGGTVGDLVTAPKIQADTWYWIVLSSRTIGAGSSYSVKVATVGGLLTARTGLTSASTSLTARNVDNVRFSQPRGSMSIVYVRGGTGAFASSDQWEIPSKSRLPIAGAGDFRLVNWTAQGGGSLASEVGEVNQDADNTYVKVQTAPTAVAADRFSGRVAAAPRNAATIYATETTAAARLSQGTAGSVRIMESVGATDSAGSTQNLTTSYVDVARHQDTSPHTSAAWTISQIAATDWGLELVSLS